MSGKRWTRSWEKPDIVRVVMTARANGIGWKELAATFGLSVKQLRRYVSRERMSHQDFGMSHRRCCIDDGESPSKLSLLAHEEAADG